MRIPKPSDFRAIENWGLVANPMAAISDYSVSKEKRRWKNERHCRAHREYKTNTDTEFIQDAQSYYQSLQRPIGRTKWEYLKQRKAWFHPPLGWNQFAAPGVSRILDLGCGDGDLTQRVADHVAGAWTRAGYDGFPLEIVGIDLSESRIRNARRHTASPHKKITLSFALDDALAGLDYEDHYFDYTLLMGVLEIMDGEQFEHILHEVARLTARGIYVRDIIDEYPGMTPRPHLIARLEEKGFSIKSHEQVFEEPFVEDGSKDPLEIWPMNVNQVIHAEREDYISPAERY